MVDMPWDDSTTGGVMTEIPEDRIFNEKEAAAYMRFSPGSLAVFRCKKTHDLKYFKIGRSIRYRKSECDRFLEARLIKPLGE